MSYTHKLFRQLGEPKGLIGRLLIKLLNHVNRKMNALTRTALDLKREDTILEIGFGGGALIADILANDEFSHLTGIDISSVAVVQTKSRFREAIANGRVDIRQCGQAGLDFNESRFSRVCCVNVIYFWPDVEAMLAEIYRVLSPDGKLVLSYSIRSPDKETKFTREGVEARLSGLGFVKINSVTGEDRENDIYYITSATKPWR